MTANQSCKMLTYEIGQPETTLEMLQYIKGAVAKSEGICRRIGLRFLTRALRMFTTMKTKGVSARECKVANTATPSRVLKKTNCSMLPFAHSQQYYRYE